MIFRPAIACSAVAAVLLVGCGKGPSEAERLATRAARVAKAEAEASKPVAPRVHQVGANELVTVEVPIADQLGFTETQRCFVWRDLEMRTASLSCPQPPEINAPK